MDGDLQNLPDDAETLKAMIADMRRSQSSLQAEVAALRAAGVDAQVRIDRLQLLLKTIQRATYGRSSEKLNESQLPRDKQGEKSHPDCRAIANTPSPSRKCRPASARSTPCCRSCVQPRRASPVGGGRFRRIWNGPK